MLAPHAETPTNEQNPIVFFKAVNNEEVIGVAYAAWKHPVKKDEGHGYYKWPENEFKENNKICQIVFG